MNIFDSRAATYDQLEWVKNTNFLDRIFAAVQVFAQNNTHYLDLATGTGAVLSHLAPHYKFSIGLDASKLMLQQAFDKIPKQKDLTCAFCLGIGENLPFRDSVFDLITCRNGLHHFNDIRQGMLEIYRVIKKNGVACIVETVAPSQKSFNWWKEVVFLKDVGRNPEFCFDINGFAYYINKKGFEILDVIDYKQDYIVLDWLQQGGVEPERAQKIIKFHENAPKCAKEELNIRYDSQGKLVATKTMAIVVASPKNKLV